MKNWLRCQPGTIVVCNFFTTSRLFMVFVNVMVYKLSPTRMSNQQRRMGQDSTKIHIVGLSDCTDVQGVQISLVDTQAR